MVAGDGLVLDAREGIAPDNDRVTAFSRDAHQSVLADNLKVCRHIFKAAQIRHQELAITLRHGRMRLLLEEGYLK